MEFDFGIITGIEIKENLDGNQSRFLQCQVTADEDGQLVELIAPFGDDGSPPRGASVFIIDTGGRRIGFLLNDGIVPESVSEEKEIYSSSGGSKAGRIILRTDGTAEINGAGDFAVKFNQLQTIMNNLAAALNAEFIAIAAAIGAIGGAYAPTPISIDLTPAKTDNVKLP